MTSDFRKEFESKFPVPKDVYWNDGFDCDGAYESDCEWAVSIAVAYDHKWRGYCAGYVAASYSRSVNETLLRKPVVLDSAELAPPARPNKSAGIA